MVIAAKRIDRACEQNVVELVRAHAGPTAALKDMKTGVVRTFAELRTDLDETSAALLATGLAPGDRVALFVADGIAFTTLVFSCFQAGLVPVLIDPGMGAANVLRCVREQRPKGLVGIAKAHLLGTLAWTAFASVKARVLVHGNFFPGAQPLSKLRRSGIVAPVHTPAPNETAAILYTSGSTGPPKGVVYTHAMLAAQARAIREMFDIQAGEVDVACFLPFGLFSVAMGMTAVFPDMDFSKPAKADPHKILRALDGATSAFASPALWEPFSRWLDAPIGLKRILTAGAPVSPSLHERLLKQMPHGDVFTPYGATEALPVSFMSGRAIVEETAALTRAGKGTCVGTLAPGVEVKIIGITDDAIATMRDAVEMPRGEIGEIVVRGPCVTQAYDHRPEANAHSKIADDSGGLWHRMGDVGYVDERGRLWFCGRKAHRVDTPTGTLHSIPVEAQVETLWPERAALVGLGPRGKQAAVIVLECCTKVDPPLVRKDFLAQVRALPGCAAIDDVVLHFGPFPVDRRHNAKIERERLAQYAARKLPGLAGGKP